MRATWGIESRLVRNIVPLGFSILLGDYNLAGARRDSSEWGPIHAGVLLLRGSETLARSERPGGARTELYVSAIAVSVLQETFALFEVLSILELEVPTAARFATGFPVFYMRTRAVFAGSGAPATERALLRWLAVLWGGSVSVATVFLLFP